MRALLRVYLLTAIRQRATIYALVALSLLSWCFIQDEISSYALPELVRAIAVFGLGVIWGVGATSVPLGSHQAPFLRTLPVRTRTAWLATWIASAAVSLGFAAIILTPELSVVASLTAAGSSASWLASPGALLGCGAMLALAGQAAGMLGRSLTVRDMPGLLVALSLVGAFCGLLVRVQVAWGMPLPLTWAAPAVIAAMLASWIGSWIAFGIGAPLPGRGRRVAAAAALAACTAVVGILVVASRARAWASSSFEFYDNLQAIETSAGPRVLVRAYGASYEPQLLVADPSGGARVVARGVEACSVVGDRALVTVNERPLLGAPTKRLVAVNLVTHERDDWGRITWATREADDRCCHVLSEDGTRLVTLEGEYSASLRRWTSSVMVRDHEGHALLQRACGVRTWLATSGHDLLVCWQSPRQDHGGAASQEPPLSHLMWVDMQSGHVSGEREVPEVVAVSRDLKRIACLDWTRDEVGWAPALLLLDRDGGRRELVPRSALEAFPDPRTRWPDGALAAGQSRSAFHPWPEMSRKQWLAIDGDVTRVTWLHVTPGGRAATCEVVTTDVGTGASRTLVPADALPITSARGGAFAIALRGLTADGTAALLTVGPESWLVDLEDGRRSIAGPPNPYRFASPSGRRIASYDHQKQPGPLFVMTITPNGPRRIFAKDPADVTWLDEGRLLVEASGPVLQLVDADTGRRTMLLP